MAKKKWWHFELPFGYYQCHVLGGGPPKKKHISWFIARMEAVRLAKQFGLPVVVLKTIEVILPQQIAPAPEMTIRSYEGRYDEFANWPNDIAIPPDHTFKRHEQIVIPKTPLEAQIDNDRRAIDALPTSTRKILEQQVAELRKPSGVNFSDPEPL